MSAKTERVWGGGLLGGCSINVGTWWRSSSGGRRASTGKERGDTLGKKRGIFRGGVSIRRLREAHRSGRSGVEEPRWSDDTSLW